MVCILRTYTRIASTKGRGNKYDIETLIQQMEKIEVDQGVAAAQEGNVRKG